MTATTTRLRLRVSHRAASGGGKAADARPRWWGAGRAAIVGRHGDGWKVRVTEPPEHGRANDAVVRLLASALAVPRDAVAIVSGHSARDKIVELTGVGPTLIVRRLSSASAPERVRKDRRG